MKKNIPLIIGVLIPILMIVFVAASIYLPALFTKPKYDFLYSTDDIYYGPKYLVENNKLTQRSISNPDNYPYPITPKLFIHDITLNQTREISFERAQGFNLDSNILSPDGFEVVNGSSSASLLFFFYSTPNYGTKYITGHGFNQKLNLVGLNNNYDFKFLGWIMK